MKRFLTCTLVLSVVLVALPISAAEPVVIYLVRHAEKVDAGLAEDPKNPRLSEKGQERADELARLLGEAGVTRIFSTDYLRTVQTVEPTGEALGIEIELYDPHRLEAFAKSLRCLPGRHLVSGHSNTTPALVEHLGGDPGLPITESTEYDRLYVLFIESEETTTVTLRYGSSSKR
ncbi:MAG: phosphoglycerate mutase family protein [Thermoanaerobaculia bacterium]|nr:phosphoglycerate mutase family protein [Thermoanaerobaculia bacterium]